MTGRRLVTFLAQLRGDTLGPEVDALAKKLDIDIDRPLTHMSSGMKRKVALLAVLVPKVPLIILDEPTNTLDPTMRDELLEQLRQAKAAGRRCCSRRTCCTRWKRCATASRSSAAANSFTCRR